jgi:hypothetical protein
VLDRVLPLARAGEAQKLLEDPRRFGKIELSREHRPLAGRRQAIPQPEATAMKPLAALVPLALLALAGCGDTCTSKAAEVRGIPGSCTVPVAASSTIEVQLCPKCTDSTPGCQAEFRNGRFEVAPTFQECQAEAGCQISSECGFNNSKVACSVSVPAGTPAATYDVIDSLTLQTVGSATVVSGAGSCSLGG